MNIHKPQTRPDFIFEVCWEICNKVGGVHTVLSTKAPYIEKQLGPNYILIGPDVNKDTEENKIFIEDKLLYTELAETAQSKHIYIRIGRWNIPGQPIAILVDFSQYFNQKDVIFANMWETYQLDSLTDNWDYIEPALFGYAAAKVIEHFYESLISSFDKMIVHCHEWKTGLCLLEVKKTISQAGCIFTIHNTVVGRTLANNHFPIYDSNFQFENIINSNQFQLRSKYYLEKIAAQTADCYTTVSDINAKESEFFYGIKPCMITPNGFDFQYEHQRNNILENRDNSKRKLLLVTSHFFGIETDEDTMFVFISGMYELKTKGIDVFLKSLQIIKEKNINKKIIAVMAITANHSGPNNFVDKQFNNTDNQTSNRYSTHHLLNIESDQIVNTLKEIGIHNIPEDKVKVLFIPAYLDGNDGIINMSYYELLSVMNLTIFPSYYEAWGYTPVESIALGVPTMTTALSGFGQWMLTNTDKQEAVHVIDRNETNENEVIDSIVQNIIEYSEKSTNDISSISNKAIELSKNLSWNTFLEYYWKTYEHGITKADERKELYRNKRVVKFSTLKTAQAPIWNKVFVSTYFSDKLLPLKELSQNIWWSWNQDAIDLFESISPQLWEKSEKNPIALIEQLEIKQIHELENDTDFLERTQTVYKKFTDYMSAPPPSGSSIAYFCMEYGIHSSIKLYSGGLGILAGDYLKEASDTNRNFIAIGLLYRYGYFNQKIAHTHDQISEKTPQKFTQLPLKAVRDKNGNWQHITLVFPGRKVIAKIWVMQVGRIPLYLLDTDLEENSEIDREITHQLYGGEWENRFKQELLLGIGGIRLLKALEIEPDLYHLNEGHAAFLNFERLRLLIHDEKLHFNQAIEVLKATSLFTTHTPVPAGHDKFDENLMRAYLSHYPERFNITWEQFMDLGRFNPGNHNEDFFMSVLALRLSQECNGVSKLHGKVSREMFANLYHGYFPEEIHISHVTNGVHYQTWAAPEWQDLLTQNKTTDLDTCLNDINHWKHIYNISDTVIWELRNKYRTKLIDFINQKIAKDYTSRQVAPKSILETLEQLDPNTLIIGFARRFATYKRATLLFKNPERLRKIIQNSDFPILFLFAGKAHPKDIEGQQILKEIIRQSMLPEFLGKIIFLENYDADIALHMVQGVDVWLNTPTRPKEASGTSGEKCVMNGVLHFSVLDGWWSEGYVHKAGWALKEAGTYEKQELQDELDAETIYSILEQELIPMFYKRASNGIPCEWVQFIKKSLCEIAPHYTTRRMMNDYYEQFYDNMFRRAIEMKQEHYQKTRRIAAWKKKTELLWNKVELLKNKSHNSTVRYLQLGEYFHADIIISTAGLNPEDIHVELVFGQKEIDKVERILFTEELVLTNVEDNAATYMKDIEIRKAGVIDYAIRVYSSHPELPHPTDSGFVKWV